MNEQRERLSMTLSDAGLGQEAIAQAERLMEAGRTEELIRFLRLCRCGLMDDLHTAQRRVDRLDHLIRHAGKAAAAK